MVRSNEILPHPDISLAQQLADLEKAQLLRRAPDPELAYLFKHSLTQEATYLSLLKNKRADLHREVALAIEQLEPGQLDRNSATLAWHYELAGIPEKAFLYSVLAGDRAARAFAHTEALMLYDRALHLGSTLSAQGAELEPGVRIGSVYVLKGRVLEVMGDHPAAVETYRAMILYAQQLGDEAMEADGLNHLVTAQVVLTGPSPEIDAQLERARMLGERIGKPELTARALWNLGLAYRFTDPARAVDAFHKALVLAEAADLQSVAAHVRLDVNVALALLGRLREGHATARQALENFRALDLKPMIADALAAVAAYEYSSGAPGDARALAEEGRGLSRSMGNPWGTLYNQLYLLIFDMNAGLLERVLSRSEDTLLMLYQLGNPFFVMNCYALLIRTWLELNQPGRAQSYADKAKGEFQDSPLANWAQWLQAMILLKRAEVAPLRALAATEIHKQDYPLTFFDEQNWVGEGLAELALLDNRPADGLAHCDRLLLGFEREEQAELAGRMYYWRARLHLADKSPQPAEQDAHRARELLERAENRILLWRAEFLLAELFQSQHREGEAVNARARAREVVTYIADHSPPEFRASFLDSPDVRQVMGV